MRINERNVDKLKMAFYDIDLGQHGTVTVSRDDINDMTSVIYYDEQGHPCGIEDVGPADVYDAVWKALSFAFSEVTL